MKNNIFQLYKGKRRILYERREYHTVGPAGLIAIVESAMGGLCDGRKCDGVKYAICDMRSGGTIASQVLAMS